MVALTGEGHVTPSAEQVAARAGVGLRSVFRHFADMDSLYAGMAERIGREYGGWLDPFEGADWRTRLGEMLARRTATYERLMPYKRAADAHRHMSTTIQRNHEALLATMRERLVALLPSVLAEDTMRLETLDLLLSFETWLRLRSEQGLDAERAFALVEAAIERTIAEG